MIDKIKMFIDNEEVVSSNEFTINEEMLSASSTILNNCYPKSWELTKDYITNFYYPKDYSKLIIGKGKYEKGNTEFTILEEKSKNLFNVNWLQGAYSFSDGKTLFQSTQYIRTSSKIDVESGKTYTLSMSENYSGYIGYLFYNNDTWISNQTNTNGTITIPSGVNKININIYKSSGIRPQLATNTMFNVGSQALTYEPYNISNLEYETNVEKDLNKLIVNGDSYRATRSGINLLQNIATTQTINDMTYTINTDGTITLNGTASASSYLLLSNILTLNGTYTLSGGSNLGMYVYMRGLNIDNGYSVDIQTHPNTYGTATLNSRYVFYIYVANGATFNNTKIYPQLELGSTPTPFEEYGKQPSPDFPSDIVNVGYQNIFNKSATFRDDSAAKSELNTGVRITEVIVGDHKYSSVEIGRDELLGKTITISSKVSVSGNNNAGIYLYWGRQGTTAYQYLTGMQVIGDSFITKLIPSEFPSGADRINLLLYANVTGTAILNDYVDYEDLQIEISDTKHSYIPYNKYGIEINITNNVKSNTQLYVLDEPLRVVGDARDRLYIENNKLYVERNVGETELKGTENWVYQNVYTNTNLFSLVHGLTNYRLSSYLLCNYFEWDNSSNDYNHIRLGGSGNIQYYVFIDKTIASNLANFKTWLTSHNLIVQYQYNTPVIEELGEVEMPTSYEGQNNVSIYSGALNGAMDIFYYWKNFDVLFSGIVKNSGEISLNPREPHYCNLQILDYKTFLSESDTLDFVITNKTIREAIQMVVDSVSGYGFQMGTINITQADDIIGAYSTLNQSPYDVLQYLASISGSRWRARYVDSSSMAIDFYDPDLLPQANSILYTKEYFEDNNIIDLTFSYGTRDYRNKQIVLSDEVYGDIDYTQNIYADGYTQEFLLEENIGNIKSLYLNGVIQDVITKEEKDNGVEGDFYYTPGKNTISSVKLLSVNNEIVITYTPLIKGRQIVYNSDEVNRISEQTGTIGIISRYETRNDIFSNAELNQVGQTYINFKGTAEILLTVQTKDNDIFNIGEVAYFDAPINELKQYYMVKTKRINYVVINGIPTLFYEYQLTSSYNNEKAINYFDNQRNKAQGNIQLGQTITRNIDIESEAIIIWQNLEINEVELEINNNNTLNNIFNSPFTE